MGSYGQRKVEGTGSSKESPLLVTVNDIIDFARRNGYFSGESMDIEKLITESDRFNKELIIKREDMNPNQSGRLFYDETIQKYVISVNRLHHKNRQKFTIAHELGHYMLHRANSSEFFDTVFFRNATFDSMEYDANKFASELLMPAQLVEEKLKSISNVGDLADCFEVSPSAMIARLKSLNYKMK